MSEDVGPLIFVISIPSLRMGLQGSRRTAMRTPAALFRPSEIQSGLARCSPYAVHGLLLLRGPEKLVKFSFDDLIALT
jgi:hypothetical protein